VHPRTPAPDQKCLPAGMHRCMRAPGSPAPARAPGCRRTVLDLGGGQGGDVHHWVSTPGIRAVLVVDVDANALEEYARRLASTYRARATCSRRNVWQLTDGQAGDFATRLPGAAPFPSCAATRGRCRPAWGRRRTSPCWISHPRATQKKGGGARATGVPDRPRPRRRPEPPDQPVRGPWPGRRRGASLKPGSRASA
jgi:hypothetical protein